MRRDPAQSAEARWRYELRSVALGGREGLSMLAVTFNRWFDHNDSGQAAALAFYSLFAVAPVLIIATAVAGLAFGREIVQSHVLDEIQALVGPGGARAVRSILDSAVRPSSGIIATAVAVFILFLGATGVFAQLQYGLNLVWEVKPKPGISWTQIVLQRFKFVVMIVGIGFLLLVSLLASTAIAAIGRYFGEGLIGPIYVWTLVNFFASLAVVTVLFAMIYKLLPDVEMAWSDVWVGALATAVLFTIGKALIGIYLGNATISSAYGAAGSLVVVLVWIYYSAQLVFLGAEFTQVWALRHGSLVKPKPGALPEQD